MTRKKRRPKAPKTTPTLGMTSHVASPEAITEAEKAPKTVGIECRVCGCRHLEVLETRPTVGGRIIRRRECRHCGARLTTYEQPSVEPAPDPAVPWWKARYRRQ